MRNKVILIGCVTILTTIILVSCTSAPEIMPESESIPKPETKPTTLPAFDMKPFHEEMNEEMRISFERSDEVIIGVYSGNHNDEQFGLIYYFDDFKSFDKTSMSLGKEMKVIVQVQEDELKPEIIKKN